MNKVQHGGRVVGFASFLLLLIVNSACSTVRSEQEISNTASTPAATLQTEATEISPSAKTATVEIEATRSQVSDTGRTVGLYDVFERQVTNSKAYTNPFDFQEIELRAVFNSPSGRQVDFFGFYDGDGRGGQTGNIWKLRFMPDEVGTWTYTYTWTDGTPGGSGSFTVADTGLPGPLQVGKDNPQYFMDGRGRPFDWRGYDMHVAAAYSPSRSILADIDWWKGNIQKLVIDRGYNFTMWDGLINRTGRDSSNTWRESWWLDPGDTQRFNLPAWHAWEEALRLAKDNRVYVITFAGMIYQGQEYDFRDFRAFLRYWVARLAPFYNFMGWSPTWEWTDIWSPEEVDEIMGYLHQINPFGSLLSVHDCSHSRFASWLSFSMRQAQSNSLLDGNSRRAGQKQGACDGEGGVGEPFLNLPIIGSEDIWETESGRLGNPSNAAEVRRAAWGIMLAGVLPLYSDWHPLPPPGGGEGTGEAEMRRLFDFIYSQTNYRQYQQLNQIVSGAGVQIVSGIPGEEYLIYIQEGGPAGIELTALPSSNVFSGLWFDPQSGAQSEGGRFPAADLRRLTSPFSGDSVLLLVVLR